MTPTCDPSAPLDWGQEAQKFKVIFRHVVSSRPASWLVLISCRVLWGGCQ